MTVSKITNAPTQKELIDKTNEIIDNLGGGGSSTDVQINGTSITNQGVANIITNSAYNASSNKIATMHDLPSTSGFEITLNKVTSISSSSTDTQYPSAKCVYDEIQTVKRNIGEIVQSTIPLTDAGLHLLDGALINGSGIYSAFVDYIAGLAKRTLYAWVDTTDNITIYSLSETLSVGDLIYYNYNGVLEQDFSVKTINPLSLNVDYISDGTSEGATKLDYLTAQGARIEAAAAQGNVQYTSSANIETYKIPPSYFCSEQEWQTSIATYGVCGKFVYDSTNNTVRLPKITGIVEGTTDLTTLGDLVEAGLPNITGDTGYDFQSSFATGAFNSSFGTKSVATFAGAHTAGAQGFDASVANSIYGNSTTVQPQTIKVLYYIVIATSTKTDIEVDIDDVVTDLNGKADVDLSNVLISKGILTESYVNGTSWYRVYSDGWCVQGGQESFGSGGWSNSIATVNLLKSYADTNYGGLSSVNNRPGYTTTIGLFSGGKTVSSFTYGKDCIQSSSAGTFSWITYGYIS